MNACNATARDERCSAACIACCRELNADKGRVQGTRWVYTAFQMCGNWDSLHVSCLSVFRFCWNLCNHPSPCVTQHLVLGAHFLAVSAMITAGAWHCTFRVSSAMQNIKPACLKPLCHNHVGEELGCREILAHEKYHQMKFLIGS